MGGDRKEVKGELDEGGEEEVVCKNGTRGKKRDL